MNNYIVCSVQGTDISGVPKEVKILPFGNVSSQHGKFIVDEESFKLINEKFKDRGIDLVIDYEHQTLQDVQAPAGGWIKSLSLKNNAIVAEVEWTKKAAEYLTNKEYRYLSPVVRVRKYDKKAVGLHSVALTNLPAIDGMFTITNKLNQDIDNDEGEGDMNLKEIALALGLAEDASEDQIKEAIEKVITEKEELKAKCESSAGEEVVANKVICELLGIKEDAKTEDVSAAIMELKAPKNATYAEEFLALKAKMEKKESQESVIIALKAGKIAPAQKEWAETYALKDPTGFAAFVDKAPVVVPYDKIEFEAVSKKATVSNEEEMKICKMMGVSKEDILKYGKEV